MPYGVQLFGHEPAVMAEAAELLLALRTRRPDAAHFDFIDINMGCPAPKITGPGAGSALLKTPELAGQVARAVVQAVAGEVPVTVKLRIGWDAATLTGAEVAKRCEDAGVAMLTVHGRTRQEMYEPGIHADEIARVKAAVRIPVWANGDVASAQGALALLCGHRLRRRGRGARRHGQPLAVRADSRSNGGRRDTARPAACPAPCRNAPPCARAVRG